MSKCEIFKNSFDIENFNVAMKPNNQDCKINQCSQPTYNFIFKAFCCPCGPSYGLCNSDDTVYDVPPYILKMAKNKILENCSRTWSKLSTLMANIYKEYSDCE